MITDYLGDGVHVDYDGYQYKLYTHRGVDDKDEIYLEPEVFVKLLQFKARVEEFTKPVQQADGSWSWK